MCGYEAGQSGVGDIFAWFARPRRARRPTVDEADRRGMSAVRPAVRWRPPRSPPGAHGLIALDWLNGNRSRAGRPPPVRRHRRPDAGHPAPDIYRALVESTAFGTRVIIDASRASGIPVTEFVVAGGLIKDEFVMQVYADVLRRPLSVISSEQGPALGSAIHAAVAAGCYPDVPAAAAAMGGKHDGGVHCPDPASADVYDELYAEYTAGCTTTSAAAATRSCTGSAALRDRVLGAAAGAAYYRNRTTGRERTCA